MPLWHLVFSPSFGIVIARALCYVWTPDEIILTAFTLLGLLVGYGCTIDNISLARHVFFLTASTRMRILNGWGLREENTMAHISFPLPRSWQSNQSAAVMWSCGHDVGCMAKTMARMRNVSKYHVT